jgi:hypothetical protein
MRVCNSARERFVTPRWSGRARVVYRTQELARSACYLSRIRPGGANDRAAKPVEKKEHMFRTPSVFGPLNSGFVPFSSGAPIDTSAEAETAKVIARVSAAPAVENFETAEVAPRAAWAPATSTRIRVVEALVVAAVCGYFAFGLLSTIVGR